MPAPKRSEEITQVFEWKEGVVQRVQDTLAAEEPLEIRIGRHPVSVTMRTPGHDQELAAGFLFTEGILPKPEDLQLLSSLPGSPNEIRAKIAKTASFDPKTLKRHFFANSSCGLCGKATIDAIRARVLHAPNAAFHVTADVLCSLPDKARDAQTVFSRTGGLHAAALFNSEGELLVLREDIGRHNAVDKVIGWAVLQRRIPLGDCVLFASGRGGFEIVQKAIVAGIPVVACVSAPSSLAMQLARRMNQTLVGFLRGRRFVIYSGEERITDL
jgi:FdhD protein